MYFAYPEEGEQRFYRNAMGDEVVYVSEGSGVLESQYGDLPYKPGDYLVIHRGIQSLAFGTVAESPMAS